MPAISLGLYHFIQIWLVLDIIAGLWFAYEIHQIESGRNAYTED